MFWKISVILVAMWVLRTLSSYAMNGFINILLVIAILILLLRLIIGRGVVTARAVHQGLGCSRCSTGSFGAIKGSEQIWLRRPVQIPR